MSSTYVLHDATYSCKTVHTGEWNKTAASELLPFSDITVTISAIQYYLLSVCLKASWHPEQISLTPTLLHTFLSPSSHSSRWICCLHMNTVIIYWDATSKLPSPHTSNCNSPSLIPSEIESEEMLARQHNVTDYSKKRRAFFTTCLRGRSARAGWILAHPLHTYIT